MKKKIFLVSVFVAMAMGMMFVSCEKKDAVEKEEINGCKCTFYYEGKKVGTEKFDIDDMEDEYDVSTCSKLEKELMREAEDYDIECKSY